MEAATGTLVEAKKKKKRRTKTRHQDKKEYPPSSQEMNRPEIETTNDKETRTMKKPKREGKEKVLFFVR